MKSLITISLAILITLAPQLLPANDAFAVDPQAKLFFEKAIFEFKAGNLEAAGSHAKHAWKKDRAVMGLDDQGMTNGFVKYLNEKIEKSPKDATIYYRLAKVKAILGLPKESAALLQKVIELTPGTELAKKAQTLLTGLGGNLAEQAVVDADKEEFIKESREEATIENIKLSNKEQAEANARLKQQTQANAQAEKQSQSDAKDKKIAELEQKNKDNQLTNDLFWANPTNAYLMENNYDKTKVKADIVKTLPVKPVPRVN